jgi:hypothetical protein
MTAVRVGLYELLRADATLMGLGAGSGTNDNTLAVFPNFTLDSPAAGLTRWMTIRWGAAEAPIGRDTETRPIPVAIWCYDRERDFELVGAALQRVRVIMKNVQGLALPGGSHLVAADWAFSSEDIWDDTYEAVARGETYRLVTNGL